MFQQAIEFHRQGRIEEAEGAYRTHLADHPDDADALYLLGRLRWQRGDFAEGGRLIERAHELAPERADIESAIAAMRFTAGDHDAARRGFERALSLDPNLPGAHAGLGQLALLRGDAAEAERLFRTAARAGDDPHALAGLASLEMQRGEIDAALANLTRAAGLAPNDAMIQFMLGQAYARNDNHAFAEQAFRNALRLRPDIHAVRPWLGAALVQEGRFDEATEVYAPLIGVPGFETAAELGLADVARGAGRHEEAIVRYRGVLERDPAQPGPAIALGRLLASLGRADEAFAVYDAVLAVVPDDGVRAARADLLAATGRVPEAVDAWSDVLLRDPGNLGVRSHLAQGEELLGRLDEASRNAEAVLRKRGGDVNLLLLRARAQLRGGDAEAARATLDPLLRAELDPAHAEQAWFAAGLASERMGRPDIAARCFMVVRSLMPEAMPVLVEPPPELGAVLAEPAGTPWAQAPVLLLGAPGSNVERVARLLAGQRALRVLGDRATGDVLEDDLDQPVFERCLGDFDEAARAEVRARLLARWQAAGVEPGQTVVEWLPRWDARMLALLRRAMPGTRIVRVERDARDELLDWLAFGWARGFRCAEPEAAAAWLAMARRHLGFGVALDDPAHCVVAADPLLDGVAGAGDALARFLGIAPIEVTPEQVRSFSVGVGGLPSRFPAGHWHVYADALAPAFARLTA